MLPGDLIRTIRRRCREPEHLQVYVEDGDESNSHRAMLYWKGTEVCALPVGMVPEDNVFEYACFRCRQVSPSPHVCRVGAPPPGFERRGSELLVEPSGQGHKVVKRLVRRGVREILELCAAWRHPDSGVRLFRS